MMLKPVLIAFSLSLAAPAMAQYAGARAPGEAERHDGFMLQPVSGAGLNAARAGVLLHGFRVAPENGAFVGYRRGNWLVGSNVAQYEDPYAEPGAALDVGGGYGIDLTPHQRLSVTGGIRLDLSSGLDTRSPHSFAPPTSETGLGLRMSWRYSFDENRYLSTTLGFDQSLSGDSYDGGVNERSGTSFGTYFGYRFY